VHPCFMAFTSFFRQPSNTWRSSGEGWLSAGRCSSDSRVSTSVFMSITKARWYRKKVSTVPLRDVQSNSSGTRPCVGCPR